jgi:hypothetical protein
MQKFRTFYFVLAMLVVVGFAVNTHQQAGNHAIHIFHPLLFSGSLFLLINFKMWNFSN